MSFTASDVISVTGLSYRQLDHFVRGGILQPSGGGGKGRGSPRRFRVRDLLAFALLAEALYAGARVSTVAPALRLVQRVREAQFIDELDGCVVWTDGRRAVFLPRDAAGIRPPASRGLSYLLDLGAAAALVRARLKEVAHIAA